MPRMTPAVLRSFDILELFLASPRALSAPEIAQLTGLPRTTVFELLATLTSRKYLDRDESAGRYRLGVRVFQLGNVFADGMELHRVGQRVAESVAAACAETVNVGILDNADVVYLCKVESTQAVRMVSRTGGRLPASCTAVGKALLAHLPAAQLGQILEADGGLPRLTPKSITDPSVLRDQLDSVRTTGLAYEEGESTPDVSCVAAPVRDHRGGVVAALSISVPDMRWRQRPVEEWASMLSTGAREFSAAIGGGG